MMVDYVEKILAAPNAPQQLEALHEALKSEKERRHDFREWITPAIKAEFINGEVILHSPVKKRHFNVTDLLSSLLSFFVRKQKLGRVATEKAMITLTRNDYEPDLVFFKKERFDTFRPEQMLFPAPDFVVEILSSKTASRDKGVKKVDYAAHGIQEYWIIDPVNEKIEQYILFSPEDTVYSPPKIYGHSAEIESKVIKGFVIPVIAIFDEAINLEVLEEFMKK